jgi:type II secretory pathway pseudopilin PulG
LNALSSEELRRRRSRGASIAELLIVLLFIGLIVTVTVAAWQNTARSSEAQAAAKLVQGYLNQTRMYAVYRATNHFLVIDPTQRTVSIYEDSGTTTAKFDSADTLVRKESWPASVSLALPPSSSSVADPLGGTTSLTSAWSLPFPDTTARWGTSLTGLMAIPTGRIQSGESTPQTISSGAMIFSDNTSQAAAVGVRGQFGATSAYQLLGATWKALR